MGVRAIVTNGPPWRGLERERSGWWIDHGIEPLKTTLLKATSLAPLMRKQRGARRRAWMEKDFSWGAIGDQVRLLYDWMQRAGDRLTSSIVTRPMQPHLAGDAQVGRKHRT